MEMMEEVERVAEGLSGERRRIVATMLELDEAGRQISWAPLWLVDGGLVEQFVRPSDNPTWAVTKFRLSDLGRAVASLLLEREGR